MPHALMNRTADDGKLHSYPNPFMVSMRYHCECTGGEVIQISTVFDFSMLQRNGEEEAFLWTIKRMLRDMRIEIAQHTKQAEQPKPEQNYVVKP
jgi:hypothetical protein